MLHLSFVGANGLQLTTAHFVQEESWRVARTPPTVLENSGRVGRLQREQSAVQRISVRSLVISQRCKVFLDNAVLIFRTLFHTLTVSAASKDPAFPYGGVSSVANSMIGLTHYSTQILLLTYTVGHNTLWRLCQPILQLQGVRPSFCEVYIQYILWKRPLLPYLPNKKPCL